MLLKTIFCYFETIFEMKILSLETIFLLLETIVFQVTSFFKKKKNETCFFYCLIDFDEHSLMSLHLLYFVTLLFIRINILSKKNC